MQAARRAVQQTAARGDALRSSRHEAVVAAWVVAVAEGVLMGVCVKMGGSWPPHIRARARQRGGSYETTGEGGAGWRQTRVWGETACGRGGLRRSGWGRGG